MRLIFTYIGSHDDCQRWIENNRDYQDEIESVPVPHVGAEEERPSETVTGTGQDHDEYEEQLLVEIDERVLREIFSGLCSNG